MNDGTGLAEALLGLPGFRVLEVIETPDELVVRIETMAGLVGCTGCGTRAEAHDRNEVAIRDLPCFGRPARLVWVTTISRELRRNASTRTWRLEFGPPRRSGTRNALAVPRRRSWSPTSLSATTCKIAWPA